MNLRDRVVLIDGTTETTVPASVSLISTEEVEGVFTNTDLSIRVPRGWPVLPTTGTIRVLTGPHAGYSHAVTQIRPNRDHVRYIA